MHLLEFIPASPNTTRSMRNALARPPGNRSKRQPILINCLGACCAENFLNSRSRGPDQRERLIDYPSDESRAGH